MLTLRPISDVYLDTAFVVNAVISQGHDSHACVQASDQLIEQGCTVYFSEVLRIEYAQALRRLATRLRLPSEVARRFALQHWQHVEVRRRWMTYGFEQMEPYLSLLPEVVELPLRRPILDQSVQYMALYSLGSLDSVQLATALHYEIPTFWTCDEHFQRVDELDVEIIRTPERG